MQCFFSLVTGRDITILQRHIMEPQRGIVIGPNNMETALHPGYYAVQTLLTVRDLMHSSPPKVSNKLSPPTPHGNSN
jgi:hypothetical protein